MLVMVAAAAVLHGVWTTPLWGMIRETFRPHESYEQMRSHMFSNFPIDDMNAKLNTILGPSTPVELGEGIFGQVGLSDHVAAGMFPRRPHPDSPYTLDLVGDPGPSSSSIDLARTVMGTVRLSGPGLEGGVPIAAPPADLYRFSWPGIGLGVLMLLGWGVLVRKLLERVGLPGRNVDGALAAVVTPLCAFGLLGVVATIATWSTVRAPWLVLLWVGAGMGLFHTLRWLNPRSVSRRVRRLGRSLPPVDALVLCGFLLFMFVRVASFPFSSWDPRTIWLLQADRLAHEGLISHTALLQPILSNHHAGYPLLYPASMAGFAAYSGINERMLTMGAVLLFSCATVLTWSLARRALGRWVGLAFIVVLALDLAQITAWGVADPILVMLVAAAALAFAGAAPESIGWLALGLAALTKFEGLILAGILGIGFLAVSGRLSWSRRRDWRHFAWLLPGAGHFVFVNVLGVPDDFSNTRWSSLLEDIPRRTRVLIDLIPWTLSHYAVVRVGLAAIPVTLVLVIFRRRSSDALLASGSAACAFAVLVGLMYITPKDVAWHAGSALYRLLLHPGVLGVLGFLLFLSGSPPAAGRRIR